MLKFNFAEVETGIDRAMSELERTLIGQLNFGIQANLLYFQQFKKPDEMAVTTRS